MGQIFGRLSLVSSLTLVSRFLGLARDIMFFGCFGASIIGEAFILAFTFPNLFRRMLGEGTLSSAFIPIFTDTLKRESKEKAFLLLSNLVSRLFLFLGLLAIIVILFSYFGSSSFGLEQGKWTNGLFLNSLSFGYVVFICISAILVGALNSNGRFFEGAFSPVLLNLCMVGSMFMGKFIWGLSGMNLAVLLCLSVIFAGFLQLLLPWISLRKSMGWKWKVTISESDGINRIKSLFWVGAMGAAVGQVNILISRFLAYSLEESGGLSYLFLSSRLVELPLGVFAVAISTVFFPEMSRAISSGENMRFKKSVLSGLVMTGGITIPAAAGLAILAEPILTALYQWNEFGAKNVSGAKEILVISSIGLPFYAISTFLVKVFHSQKNMRVPLNAAICSLIANFVLSLILIADYQAHGLALANVLAAVMQTLYLAFKLNVHPLRQLGSQAISILLSTGIMIMVLFFAEHFLSFGNSKLDCAIFLLCAIPMGVLTFGISFFFFGGEEIKKMLKKVFQW
ncbi:MAG: murein biosynthesis integral membrane protein MurJ [Verrucomicrobiota bacterium]|nr:murein biosynthesis integral membrane protein MurJ [Verrucomicrobiota bacterium]